MSKMLQIVKMAFVLSLVNSDNDLLHGGGEGPDYDRDLDDFIVPDAIDIVEDFDEAEASAQPHSRLF